MEVIEKNTPNSTHFTIVAPTLRGYRSPVISNQLVADFNRGVMSYEQTVSESPCFKSKASAKDFTVNYHCSIIFNGSPANSPRLKVSSNYPHVKTKKYYIKAATSPNQEHPKNTNYMCSASFTAPCNEKDRLSSIYAPLTKSNLKRLNYLNRTVVLPSKNAKSSYIGKLCPNALRPYFKPMN